MSESTPLTLADARHLLRRTGFGATAGGRAVAARQATRPAAPPPTRLLDFKPTRFKPGGRYIEDVHNKWVKYMIEDPAPAAGEAGAVLARPLRHQLRQGRRRRPDGACRTACLRQFCKGNFSDFVKAINKDPAMMEFLDTVRNHNEQPERELRARAAGAVHARRQGPARQPELRAGGHRPDRARLHRLGLRRQGRRRSSTRTTTTWRAIEDWIPPRGPKVIFKTRGGFGDRAAQSFDERRRAASSEIDSVIDIIFQHRYGPAGRQSPSPTTSRSKLHHLLRPSRPVADASSTTSSTTRASTVELGHRRAAQADLRPRRLLPVGGAAPARRRRSR